MAKPRVAPYATASALSALFDHIRYVSTPKKVDSGVLLDYGVPKSQTFPVLSTLKFLGVIDEIGAPTPAYNGLQASGDEFREALKGIVQRSYADLFGRLDVSRDARDKIKNYFARNYSPATAERATALFLDLCGEAGIATTAKNQPRQAVVASQSARKVPVNHASRQQHTPTPPPASDSRIVLEVRLTDDDLAIMQPGDISEVFQAAAKIEIARRNAHSRTQSRSDETTVGQNGEAPGSQSATTTPDAPERESP